MCNNKKVMASELQSGQIIRIEYGDYDNWVNFTVDSIEIADDRVYVKCRSGTIIPEFPFSANELLEVVEEVVENV